MVIEQLMNDAEKAWTGDRLSAVGVELIDVELRGNQIQFIAKAIDSQKRLGLVLPQAARPVPRGQQDANRLAEPARFLQFECGDRLAVTSALVRPGHPAALECHDEN